MLTALVLAVVSGALVVGAARGVYGELPRQVEGFIVALAGGALMISVVLELIEPASHMAPFWAVSALFVAGAVVFAVLDHLVKRRWEGDSGGGLLAAITLDGVPERTWLSASRLSAPARRSSSAPVPSCSRTCRRLPLERARRPSADVREPVCSNSGRRRRCCSRPRPSLATC